VRGSLAPGTSSYDDALGAAAAVRPAHAVGHSDHDDSAPSEGKLFFNLHTSKQNQIDVFYSCIGRMPSPDHCGLVVVTAVHVGRSRSAAGTALLQSMNF
jgi:hypothetical protein